LHLTPLGFCVQQRKTEVGLKPTEQPAAPLGLKPPSGAAGCLLSPQRQVCQGPLDVLAIQPLA
jgi:hypothetical protein